MLTEGSQCEEANGYNALIFYVALYLVALGSGCLKPNIISHGADQFKKEDSKKLSSFFNAAYFAFCIGELVALTALIWVQTHSGMFFGFGVSAAAMAAGLLCLISGTCSYRNSPPRGSIFTPIAQVSKGSKFKKFILFRFNNFRKIKEPFSSLDSTSVIVKQINYYNFIFLITVFS